MFLFLSIFFFFFTIGPPFYAEGAMIEGDSCKCNLSYLKSLMEQYCQVDR